MLPCGLRSLPTLNQSFSSSAARLQPARSTPGNNPASRLWSRHSRSCIAAPRLPDDPATIDSDARDGLMGVSANHPTGIERPSTTAREPKQIVEFSRLADQYPVNGATKVASKMIPWAARISHRRHDEADPGWKKFAPGRCCRSSAPNRKADRAQRVSAGALIPLKPTSSAPADTMPRW